MIDSRCLRALIKKYPAPINQINPDPLADLVRKYQSFKQTNTLDCAVLATHLTVEDLMSGVDDPMVQKAIWMTSPNFDLVSFHTKEEWMGLVNTVKGKYFELLVAEKLNAGEQVGDFILPDGYHAKLAESLTQPGWDLLVLDAHDRVSTYLQLKASESIGYIQDAMDRYPDIKILANSEVASHFEGSHMVLDAGLSEEQLRNTIELMVDPHDSVLSAFWDDFHPIIPMLVIAGTQGYRVMVGKTSARDAVEMGLARGARTMVMAATAATVKMLGGGLFSIPAAWLAGAWYTRAQSIDTLAAKVRGDSQKFALQAIYYNNAFPTGGR